MSFYREILEAKSNDEREKIADAYMGALDNFTGDEWHVHCDHDGDGLCCVRCITDKRLWAKTYKATDQHTVRSEPK